MNTLRDRGRGAPPAGNPAGTRQLAAPSRPSISSGNPLMAGSRPVFEGNGRRHAWVPPGWCPFRSRSRPRPKRPSRATCCRRSTVLYRVALSLTHNAADAEDVCAGDAHAGLPLDRALRWAPRPGLAPDDPAQRQCQPDPPPSPRSLRRPRGGAPGVGGGRSGAQRWRRKPPSTSSTMPSPPPFDPLPPRFRQIVDLVDLDGLSYQETADVLEMPIGTVMSRLHRARRRMRDRLAAEGLVPRMPR